MVLIMTLASTLLTSLNEMNDYYADGGQYYWKDDYNYAFVSDKDRLKGRCTHYMTFDQRGWTIRTVPGDDNVESKGYKSTNHDMGTPPVVRALRANTDWGGKIDYDLKEFVEPRWRPTQ